MNTFAVCYDLNKPGQNYTALIDAIKGLSSNWWHHLDSTWIIKTSLSVVDVRDRLSKHIDQSDELLIMTCHAPAAWTGFNAEGSQWLKANL